MEYRIPRFMISSGYPGVGKSTFGIGLAMALRKRNLSLSYGVRGPNLLSSNVYHRLTRRYTRTFDSQLLSDNQTLDVLRQAAVGAELVIIEGDGGLYDGTRPGSLQGSDAEFAAATSTPVVLLLDPGEYGASFSALVRGFNELARSFKVGGVIANRLQTDSGQFMVKGRSFFDAALHGFNLNPLLGALPLGRNMAPLSRGKYSFREDGQAVFPRQFFLSMGELVESHVDLDRLLEIADSAPPVEADTELPVPMNRRCRIGVADDSCFSICFQDNLDLLRSYGAQLISFSPLADSRLPDNIGGLYIPGGNIGEYAIELAANQEMKGAIRDFVANGGVVYAEGAGTAYLCQEFSIGSSKERRVEGVGVFHSAVQGYEPFLNYTESSAVEDCVLGERGITVKGISVNAWVLENDINVYKVLNLSYAKEKPVPEGYSPSSQVVGTFCFNNFASNPVVAKNFVDACELVSKLPE